MLTTRDTHELECKKERFYALRYKIYFCSCDIEYYSVFSCMHSAHWNVSIFVIDIIFFFAETKYCILVI